MKRTKTNRKGPAASCKTERCDATRRAELSEFKDGRLIHDPMNAPTCPTCRQGILTKRTTYRMSMPVVVIGYLLLVPSIFGIFFGVLGILATGGAAGRTQEPMEQEVRTRLRAAAIPEAIIADVVAGKPASGSQLSTLSSSQRSVVVDTSLSVSARKLGSGAGVVIAGGISLAVIVFSFVGGLLGWLLVMRKRVLQCPVCSATLSAA